MEQGEKFKAGGEEALEEIIDVYGEGLLRYATAILCDYQEAEDIIQDSFIAAYENRAKFDGKNLSAWLYKIVYNQSLNQLKKRKILYFSEIDKQGHNFDDRDEALSDEMLRALKILKPKERALLYSRIMEEQSYEELSQLMGISQQALRKRYQRAKDKLAKQLNLEYEGRELGYEKS